MEKADRRRMSWIASLFLVAVLSLTIFRSETTALYDAFKARPDYRDEALQLISLFLLVYSAPALIASYAFGFDALNRGSNPASGAGDFVTLCVMASISWLFYRTAAARLLKFVGLWNPFPRRSLDKPRPWIFRAILHCRLWWELQSFGQRATGGWANLLEVLCWPYRRHDIFLGRPKLPFFLGGLLRPIGIPTEKHMITIASPGSGKSTGGLMPNLCIYEGSVCCVDPKGELAAGTASRRGQGGGGVKGMRQTVHVVDPFGIVPGWETSAYNVFDELERVARIDSARPVSYANAIADALIKRTDHTNPYFDDNAHTLVAGLILYVFQGPVEHRSLLRVRELLVEGDKDALERDRADGEAEQVDSAFTALLLDMVDVPAGPYQKAIQAAAAPLLGMGPNQFGAVVSTAQEHTRFLDTPEIRRVCAGRNGRSDFLLDDLRREKTTVYLCMPLNYVSGKEGRWLRMFVMLLIDVMMAAGKRPEPPVLLAIDEFPNLGRIDRVDKIGPVMRSYGLRLWVVGQDIDQFKAVYPECYESFIGTAQAVQFMGITHPGTVAYLSEKLLGKHVVMAKSPRDGSPMQQVRNLLDSDQAARLLANRWKYQIVWRGDSKPMILKICPYFNYLPFWYYDADPRYKESWSRRLWRWGRQRPVYGPGGVPVTDRSDQPLKEKLASFGRSVRGWPAILRNLISTQFKRFENRRPARGGKELRQ